MKLVASIVATALAAALNVTSASASIVLSVGSETIAPNGTASIPLDISGLGNGTGPQCAALDRHVASLLAMTPVIVGRIA